MIERRVRTSRRADALAVLVALVLPLMLVLVYFVILVPYPPALQQTAYVLGKIVQFALPVVWVFGVERSRFVWKKPGLGGLAEGLAFGVVIAADVMLYCYSQRGELALVKPDPSGFKVISKTRVTLGSEQHWAHPVIYDGVLYLRHGRALVAYKVK